MPGVTLVRRTCRKCGRSARMAFSYDACPHCHSPYGRLEFGADQLPARDAESEIWPSLAEYCQVPGQPHKPQKDEDGVRRCVMCRKRMDQLKGARR